MLLALRYAVVDGIRPVFMSPSDEEARRGRCPSAYSASPVSHERPESHHLPVVEIGVIPYPRSTVLSDVNRRPFDRIAEAAGNPQIVEPLSAEFRGNPMIQRRCTVLRFTGNWW